MVLRKLSLESKDHPFITSAPPISEQSNNTYNAAGKNVLKQVIKIPATKLRDSTDKWKTSDLCLSSQTETEEVHDQEDHMEKDMQLEDSIKNDNGPEDEVEDEAVLVDDNERNLENDMIPVQVESDV